MESGNYLDNAVAEGFFGRLKTEFFYGRDFKTADDLVEDLGEWIDWYNTERIKISLGGMSPVDYRPAVA